MFKQEFKMIAAVMYKDVKRRWMVFADSPEGWIKQYDIRRSTRRLLDKEPQSMIKHYVIDGESRIGVWLPAQKEFYALKLDSEY